MAFPVWAVEFDWDNNGSFAYNEAAFCTGILVERGRDTPFQDAPAGKCVITLDNYTERFDPWNAGSTIYPKVMPGRKVRIKATFGGSTYAVFYGNVVDIEPSGRIGHKKVTVTAYDGWQQLERSEASIALQTDKKTGVCLGLVLDEIDWPAGAGSRNIDTGDDTIGLWWCEQGARPAVQDLTRSELGIFFFTTDGKARFISRSNANTAASVASIDQAVFSELLINNPWEFLYNKVTVQCLPTETSVGAELWRLQDTGVLVQAGQSVILWAQFHDSNDQPCIATNVVGPVVTTDYTANTVEGGGGTDMTASMAVACSAFSGAAKLTITNNHATTAFYVTLLKVRGDAITREPLTVRSEDTTSQSIYGVRELRIDVPWQQSVNVAKDFADAHLNFWKDPQKGLVVTSVNQFATALPRELGDRVTVTAALYDISAEIYRINKIVMQTLDEKLSGLQVRWILEPTDAQQWWKLGDVGYSELDDTTRLGY